MNGRVCVCVYALMCPLTVCIYVCGRSVCIMNSHRDSRAAVREFPSRPTTHPLVIFRLKRLCSGEEKLWDPAQIQLALLITSNKSGVFEGHTKLELDLSA